MSVEFLPGKKYWVANFMTPNTKAVLLDFESKGFVHLYLLSQAELAQFQAGQRAFPSHAGPLNVWNGRINLIYDPGVTFYLVVENTNETPTPIFFRVYNVK